MAPPATMAPNATVAPYAMYAILLPISGVSPYTNKSAKAAENLP